MPEMDYSKLRGRIVECGFTQKSLAEHIGMSEGQFSQKLSGAYCFKQSEIVKICETLAIDVSHVSDYFFSQRS